MWTIGIIVMVLATSGTAYRPRDSLREQVAMIRREQWRDRERLEALERRVLARGERDTEAAAATPEGLFDLLEELSGEIEGLAEELRRRQGLEEKVDALRTRQEEGAAALRQLSRQVEGIREEQRNISRLISHNTDVFEENDESEITNQIWTESGSGDLQEESFFPAVMVPRVNNKVSSKGLQTETDKRTSILHRDQLMHIKQLEERVNGRFFNLSNSLDLVQQKAQSVEEGCALLVGNVTDELRSSMALLENLQDDLGSVWKRIAKVEFNSVQSQAALDVFEQDWMDERKHIRRLENSSTAVQIGLGEHSSRLLSLEMLTTNLTLQRCRGDLDITKRHLQLENVELRLAQMNHRMDEWSKRSDSARKMDDNVLRNYREALANMARRTENVGGEILHLTRVQSELRSDVNKFVHQLPTDCSKQSVSDVTLIQIPTIGPNQVYCDVDPDGHTWIVIQRRQNGFVNFFRNWTEYRNGFGDLKAEFWIGNEVLHLLTNQTKMKLHIDMWDVLGRHFRVDYRTFRVGSELDNYTLELSGYNGNASDSLAQHSGMGFSTHDRDNDASSANCAVHHTGGWWYQHCHRADLNGRYSLGMTWYDEAMQEWLQLERVEMKMSLKRSSL